MATAAEIEAMIAAAEARRQEVALGEAVVEVWRDGRRMRLQVPTIDELNKHIAAMRTALVEAQIAEGICPPRRRRAIGLSWL